MRNVLLTMVSGNALAPLSIPYILMARLGVPLSKALLFHLKEDIAETNVPIVRSHLQIVSRACGFEICEIHPVAVSTGDPQTDFPKMLRRALQVEKEAGSAVYLDVTCGRKYFSSMMVKIGIASVPPVVDILYCFLKDRRYRGEPCPRIPVTSYDAISVVHERSILECQSSP